ncbi:glycerol-3-phosphate ABC transporter, ATP-binding protein UgpC [Bacillus sp. JCM 19046]|uniref:Multiple sugar transport system ATP-binding protein n=1 Tax=Shouchella xiaoxiensis TaxID=766895 RepID=A0ABS2T046_9BACI|nr:sn-glycerol-3-phosphate ABC transporter ATP-binding protein UgpC [Shouchella xiaoxiensis]MBM7841158.1 multiple sugar transport system ATP-binding protein [Shouchella xiaoxiensis]GAF17478.1 glycerol-3-phosphate ABC transporter, ATP-binding protein UgpC [Bacillus sp. JCM 19046]
MATIVFDHITKTFSDTKKGGLFTAVDQATFEIKDKEFLVFVGPSGCGKTTSLRMIAGLEKQTEGNIYIDDQLVNHVHPKDRDIAMVFQDYALYPHMSIEQNLSFGLKNMKIEKAIINDKIAYASKILGLEQLLERKPRELSGGQRQRVALGRAIVRNPKVFLFDEPLSNLDAKLRVQMRIELAELHQRLGATIVYVTHDQVEAMTLGQRIVVMNEGKVQQIASPQELYARPENMFVAGFIGSPAMNFIPALIESNSQLRMAEHVFEIPINQREQVTPYIGQEVMFGIRPEHIHLDQEGDVDIRVNVFEHLGAENLIYFTFNNHSVIAKVSGEQFIRPGEQVKMTLQMQKMHLFNLETNQRIG